MAELLKIKTHTTSVFDFVGAGVVKSFEEPLLAPYIGNATVFSGLAKAIIAGILDGRGGRLGNVAAIGFGVDAGEDLFKGIMGYVGGGTGGRNEWGA